MKLPTADLGFRVFWCSWSDLKFGVLRCSALELQKYFHYNVDFVMNVTDVDDKIIFRARRNHLLDEYRNAATDLTKVCLNFQSLSCQPTVFIANLVYVKLISKKREVFTCTLVASGHRGLGQGNKSGVSQARTAGILVHQQRCGM